MLRGEKTGLRARHEADVPVLHMAFYDDVASQARGNPLPWTPIAAESGHSPFAVKEPSDTAASFSVVDLASGDLAGAAALWGIDAHNRTAHLGVTLLPAFRGRGMDLDVVRVLCRYGFTVRGMRRLQVDTLADNAPMIAAATRAGFTHEGTLRRASWVLGGFTDLTIMGLLDDEWTP
jgi:RimJ/RimL family protein N-acetyltransferase